jgi:DNA-binding NarL/FixJ family response regulator
MVSVRRTLLIVDDHAGFRQLAKVILEAGGFDVIGEAVDGASALAAVDRLKPDVVLLDVALPDLNGFAVCDRLTRGTGSPAIVMTSSRDPASFRWALERSRARGFIAKGDLSGPALAELAG